MGGALSRQVLPGARATRTPEELASAGWVLEKHGVTLVLKADAPIATARFLLLFAHGNREDVASTVYFHDRVVSVLGGETLGFEYQGYGFLSEEAASSAGVYDAARDAALVALEMARNRGLPLFIAGSSLGGSAAIHSSRYVGEEIAGLILLSTFTSALQTRFPRGVVKALMSHIDMFPNDEEILSLPQTLPILILHGKDDAVVPPSHARVLADAAGTSAEVHYVDAAHNNVFTHRAGYKQSLSVLGSFIDRNR